MHECIILWLLYAASIVCFILCRQAQAHLENPGTDVQNKDELLHFVYDRIACVELYWKVLRLVEVRVFSTCHFL